MFGGQHRNLSKIPRNFKEPFQNVIVIGGKVPCQKSFSEEPFLDNKERLKNLSLVNLEPFLGDLGTFPW